jgi:ABC-2 type transport system permease protein
MRTADRAIARVVAREVRTGAIVLVVAVPAMFWAVLASASAIDLVGTAGLGALAANPAVRALYGQPFDLSTRGGFAVWRAGELMVAISALWGMLAATRILRAEEDAGRYDLLLVGPVRRLRVLGVHVMVLGIVVLLLGATVAVTFLAESQAVAGSLVVALGIGLVTTTFIGVGALVAQLYAPRRHAAGVGGLVLGTAFLVRVLADGSDGARWLRWLTPFGWFEELRAFTGDRVVALVPLVLAPVVLFGATVALERRRDVGSGLVRDDEVRTDRSRLLAGPVRFAWWERRGSALGWTLGIAVYGLVIGAITVAFTDFLASDPMFRRLAAQFGYRDLASAGGFVGSMDVFIAVLVALFAVSSVHVLWDDENDGRLDLVFAGPMRRIRWMGAQCMVIIAVTVVLVTTAGVASWVGLALGGGSLSFGDNLLAALNPLSTVALFFGLAVLVHGVHPQGGVAIAGGAVLASYVISFLGPALEAPDWVLDLSPFRHLAVVPAEPVAWLPTLVMIALGASFAAGGALAYVRRDLG